MKKISDIKLKKALPDSPGVYYMKNAAGKIIYVGKAVNLKRRVSSYFQKAHEVRIEQLVSEIDSISFKKTPSVLEALILEANEIKRLQPKYNVKERDDRSFIYLCFTNEKFPRPVFMRGHELKQVGVKKFRSVFGPYLSTSSVSAALKILRKIFPYSTDEGKLRRSCFYYHLKLCPGVCVGAIESLTYKKTIRRLELVFAGKKETVLKELKREMTSAAKDEQFEVAAKLRNQVFALEHIRDVAMLTREDHPDFGPPKKVEGVIDVFGRVEGYDISNISGVEAVASMVVFETEELKKILKDNNFGNFGGVLLEKIVFTESLRDNLANEIRAYITPREEAILIKTGKYKTIVDFYYEDYLTMLMVLEKANIRYIGTDEGVKLGDLVRHNRPVLAHYLSIMGIRKIDGQAMGDFVSSEDISNKKLLHTLEKMGVPYYLGGVNIESLKEGIERSARLNLEDALFRNRIYVNVYESSRLSLREFIEELKKVGIKKLHQSTISNLCLDERDRTLENLRAADITEINGKPIEEVITYARGYDDLIDVSQGRVPRSFNKLTKEK